MQLTSALQTSRTCSQSRPSKPLRRLTSSRSSKRCRCGPTSSLKLFFLFLSDRTLSIHIAGVLRGLCHHPAVPVHPRSPRPHTLFARSHSHLWLFSKHLFPGVLRLSSPRRTSPPPIAEEEANRSVGAHERDGEEARDGGSARRPGRVVVRRSVRLQRNEWRRSRLAYPRCTLGWIARPSEDSADSGALQIVETIQSPRYYLSGRTTPWFTSSSESTTGECPLPTSRVQS